MFTKKKKSHVSIEIKDYILRAIVAKGADPSQWKGYEMPLSQGIVEGSVIHDEMELFDVMKNNVAKWAGKKQNARIFVPDTSVLLKSFEHPDDVEWHELKGYVEMELGQSIHLPFQDPLIDVYDPKPSDGQAMLFAAPSEEVTKMIGLLLDASLEPQVADIRALCNIRLLEYLQLIKDNRTYLIADWSINELSISIFSYGQLEFLRYQSFDTDLSEWKFEEKEEYSFTYRLDAEDDYRIILTDQMLEIDRIMNFFKFSLHKGEKSVDEIIILGDNPLLPTIEEFLENNFMTPIIMLNDSVIQKSFPQFSEKFASLIGLALKEVN
ncbi:pilus assembly protein PilM [Lysinibacillus sphaericus]|uniref:type IV pilus biogenesis protein PilM n=1 Tax=Lysinibacillus sphaericus TaxID=1421 RepID=UPI0018CD2601|nr:pilus assembly protein PilM [Lysinibacillus sphaericus]MBG9456629.1 pilus assembly protein PilM [Lysinibacillus sphaericus]MBG9480028.1 pilus assembly protein PilM [Lysinibacillus sphaericus]MBG9594240.1 pilus assembly protein PilM [Lysinibacillus sphaericus]